MIYDCFLQTEPECFNHFCLFFSDRSDSDSEGFNNVDNDKSYRFPFQHSRNEEVLHHTEFSFELINKLVVERNADCCQSVSEKCMRNVVNFLIGYDVMQQFSSEDFFVNGLSFGLTLPSDKRVGDHLYSFIIWSSNSQVAKIYLFI
jgi:hypothetical protein